MAAGNRNRNLTESAENFIDSNHEKDLLAFDEAEFSDLRCAIAVSQSEWDSSSARAYRSRQFYWRSSISSSTETGNFSGNDYGCRARLPAEGFGNRQRSTGTGGNYANYGSASQYARGYPAKATPERQGVWSSV